MKTIKDFTEKEAKIQNEKGVVGKNWFCCLCDATIPNKTKRHFFDNGKIGGRCPECKRKVEFVDFYPVLENIEKKEENLAWELKDNEKRKHELLESYDVFEKNKKGEPTGHVNCIKLAKLLLEVDERHYIVTRDNQEIFSYNRSYYEPCGEAIIRERVQYYLNDEVRGLEHIKNEVCGYIRNHEYTNREELNPPLHLINVKNGVLNLNVMKLYPHHPDFLFLQEIPVIYKPETEIDKIKKFLEATFNQEDLTVIQEFLGDCLYRSHRYKKALMLVGPTDTGKSQFLLLVGMFIGENNTSHVPLDQLCHDKFATVKLYGKLVNIRSELHIKTLHSVDIFLMLTGGDVIGAERKYQEGFNFKNVAKLIFSCNEIPDSENKNNAYYNRWIPIECSNVIPNEEQIPNFFETISTEEEISGLFNYAIIGLKRLLKSGKYSDYRSIDAVRDFMQKGKNPVLEFVNQYIIRNPDHEELKGFVHQSYTNFCKLMGYPVKESNVFSRIFKTLGPMGLSEGETRKGGHKRVWRGILCTYVSTEIDTIDKQQEKLQC